MNPWAAHELAGGMRVTDLRDLVDLADPSTSGPVNARRIAEYLGAIVEAATANPRRGERVTTAVPCRRRPGRRRCAGMIAVQRTDVPERIRWWCEACGDDGVVHHWRDTPWDFSNVPAEPFEVQVLLDVEEHAALRAIDLWDADPERMVLGAERVEEGVVLYGSRSALEQLTDQVAAEADTEPRARRRRLLDAACAKLEEGL